MPTQDYVLVPVWQIRLVVGLVACVIGFIGYLLRHQTLWIVSIVLNRFSKRVRARLDEHNANTTISILFPLDAASKWSSHIECTFSGLSLHKGCKLKIKSVRVRLVYDLNDLRKRSTKVGKKMTAAVSGRRQWPKPMLLLNVLVKTFIVHLLNKLEASIQISDFRCDCLVWIRPVPELNSGTDDNNNNNSAATPLFNIRDDNFLDSKLQLFSRPCHYQLIGTALDLKVADSHLKLSVNGFKLSLGAAAKKEGNSNISIRNRLEVHCGLDPLCWLAQLLGDQCRLITNVKAKWDGQCDINVILTDLFRDVLTMYHRVQVALAQPDRPQRSSSTAPPIPLDISIKTEDGLTLRIIDQGGPYALLANSSSAHLTVSLCHPHRPGNPTGPQTEAEWDCLTDRITQLHRSMWLLVLGPTTIHSHCQTQWDWWKAASQQPSSTPNFPNLDDPNLTCIGRTHNDTEISVLYERIPPEQRPQLPPCLRNASYRQQTAVLLDSVDCLLTPGDLYHWWQVVLLGRKVHRYSRHMVTDPEAFAKTRESDTKLTAEAHHREKFDLNTHPTDWWQYVREAKDQSVKYLKGIGEYWDFFAGQQRDLLVLEVRGTLRVLTGSLDIVDTHEHPSAANQIQLVAPDGVLLVSTTTLCSNYFNGSLLHVPSVSAHTLANSTLEGLQPLVVNEPVGTLAGLSVVLPSKASRMTLFFEALDMGRADQEVDELALDVVDMVNLYNMILMTSSSALYWKKWSPLANIYSCGPSLPQNFAFCIGGARLLSDQITLSVADLCLFRDYSGLSNEGMIVGCDMLRLLLLRQSTADNLIPTQTSITLKRLSCWHMRPRRYTINTSSSRSMATTSDDDDAVEPKRTVLEAMDCCRVVDDWLSLTHEELEWKATDLPVLAEGTIEPRVIKVFAETCRLRLSSDAWLRNLVGIMIETFVPTFSGILEYPGHLKDICALLSRRVVPCQSPLMALLFGSSDVALGMRTDVYRDPKEYLTVCDDSEASVRCVGASCLHREETTSTTTPRRLQGLDLHDNLPSQLNNDIEGAALDYLISVWEIQRGKLVKGAPPWQVPIVTSSVKKCVLREERRDLLLDTWIATHSGRSNALDIAIGGWKLRAMSQITFKATPLDTLTCDAALAKVVYTSVSEVRALCHEGKIRFALQNGIVRANPCDLYVGVDGSANLACTADSEVNVRRVLETVVTHMTMHCGAAILSPLTTDTFDGESPQQEQSSPGGSPRAHKTFETMRLAVHKSLSVRLTDSQGSLVVSAENLKLEDDRRSGRFIMTTCLSSKLQSAASLVTLLRWDEPLNIVYEACLSAVRLDFGGSKCYIDLQVEYLTHLQRLLQQARSMLAGGDGGHSRSGSSVIQYNDSAIIDHSSDSDRLSVLSPLTSIIDQPSEFGQSIQLNIGWLCRGMCVSTTNGRCTMEMLTGGLDLQDLHSTHLEVQEANFYVHDGPICTMRLSLEEMTYTYDHTTICHEVNIRNPGCAVHLPLLSWCLRPLIYGMRFLFVGVLGSTSKANSSSPVTNSIGSPTISTYTLSTEDMDGAYFSRITSRADDDGLVASNILNSAPSHLPIRVHVIEPVFKCSAVPLAHPEPLVLGGSKSTVECRHTRPDLFKPSPDAIYCHLLTVAPMPSVNTGLRLTSWWGRMSSLGIVITQDTGLTMKPCEGTVSEDIISSFEVHCGQMVLMRTSLASPLNTQKHEWDCLRRYFADHQADTHLSHILRQTVCLSATYKEALLGGGGGLTHRYLEVPKLIVSVNAADYHHLRISLSMMADLKSDIQRWLQPTASSSSSRSGRDGGGHSHHQRDARVCIAARVGQGSITLEAGFGGSACDISVSEAIQSLRTRDYENEVKLRLRGMQMRLSKTKHILECRTNEIKTHVDLNVVAHRTTRQYVEIGDILVNSSSDALLKKKGDFCARVLAPLSIDEGFNEASPVFRWTALSTSLSSRTVKAATGHRKIRRSRIFHAKSKSDVSYMKPDPTRTTFPLFPDLETSSAAGANEDDQSIIEVYEFMRITFHPLSLNLSQRFLVEITTFFSAAAVAEQEAAELERRKILESWQAAEAQLLGAAESVPNHHPPPPTTISTDSTSSGGTSSTIAAAAAASPGAQMETMKKEEGSNPVFVKEVQVNAQRLLFSYNGLMRIEDAVINLPAIDLRDVKSSSLSELLGAELSWYMLKAIVTQAVSSKVKGIVRRSSSRKLKTLLEDRELDGGGEHHGHHHRKRRFSVLPRSRIETPDEMLSGILQISKLSRRRTWQGGAEGTSTTTEGVLSPQPQGPPLVTNREESSAAGSSDWHELPAQYESLLSRVARSFSSSHSDR